MNNFHPDHAFGIQFSSISALLFLYVRVSHSTFPHPSTLTCALVAGDGNQEAEGGKGRGGEAYKNTKRAPCTKVPS
jgi:hypothetical protein